MSPAFSLLQQRYSTPSRQLGEPAPDEPTLRTLLEAAIRVPDHGKLAPFRLIRLEGDSRLKFGEQLMTIAAHTVPPLSEARLQKEQSRYAFAPLVMVVVAKLDPQSKVPQIEQKLTAGCVAHNLLLGAYAMGFGAQWLTGWAAYSPEVAKLLGLTENELVIGFVHIGTPQIDIPDRERPKLDSLLSTWVP